MSKNIGTNLQKELKSRYSSHDLPPLPLLSALKEYEEILPGITDRIITSYEKQQAHKIELEKVVMNRILLKLI